MKKSKKLHTLYSMIFIGMSTLIIGSVVALAGWQSSQNLREESGKSLVVTAETMGNQLDQHMWARYGEVEILAQLEPFRNPTDLDRTRQLINQFKETFPMFSWIGLTDAEGTVIAATDEILEGASIAERPVYLEAQQQPFIGDVHEAVLLAELLPNPSGEVMQFVDISLPMDDRQPTPVLATHLSWEWARGVEQQVMAPLEADKGIELFVVSERDQTILLGPEQWIGKSSPFTSELFAEERWIETNWGEEGSFVTARVETDGYLDYEGLEWTILARQPTSIAYQPANELIQLLIFSGIVLVLFAGAFGWFFAKRLLRPVRELSVAADELRLGERDTIPTVKGIEEFELLSLSLNNMVERLQDTRRRLGTMEQLAERDFLTGLPNRRALEAVDIYEDGFVFYMDLDGFKGVNDTLGHHAGDALLIEVAHRIQAFMKPSELAARVGGDEFIFITKGPQTIAEKRIRELMAKIVEPYYLEGQQTVIGVSSGGRKWDSGLRLETVLQDADVALYKVKVSGKNDVRFFVPSS